MKYYQQQKRHISQRYLRICRSMEHLFNDVICTCSLILEQQFKENISRNI